MDGEVLEQGSLRWLPYRNTYKLIGTDILPPVDQITSVHGFVWNESKLLMFRHHTRGWDIPGGHRDRDERCEETLIRETREETGEEIQIRKPLAYMRIELLERASESRYPYPISYIQFYLAEVEKSNPFLPTEESLDRNYFDENEIRETQWFQNHKKLWEYAKEIYNGK